MHDVRGWSKLFFGELLRWEFAFESAMDGGLFNKCGATILLISMSDEVMLLKAGRSGEGQDEPLLEPEGGASWTQGPDNGAPWPGRATLLCGGPTAFRRLFAYSFVRKPKPQRVPHEGLQPPLERRTPERKELSGGRIHRGNSLPEGEIDAIANVIELDIISIIIIIISIYTSPSPPRHRYCKKEKILTKFAGESYEFNFSKFTKTPYKADLPSDDFKMEQCASIVLVPNNPLQQHLENSESEVFRKERDELEEIFLRQPILKHDLPVEDLGTTPPPKEDPVFDLKPLPDNLKYAHIDDKKIYPVIISSKLSEIEEERLLEILKKHRGAIGYTLDDLKGISPSICQHAINMEDDAKPVVEHQRRLIPKMKEVVRNEVLKLLEAGIIYPIADSRWVSPVHCVPKKGGMTVVPNDNDELIPQRVVVGYRMCIDFRKVNKVTKKDHYPLPFIDQMLERLSKNTHFCFLDGYSGFSQIAVKAKDQEKTTFTCPYGTYAYRRMPFGLCNAPTTFQRCMSAIFHGFCESIVERCEETNLVLNWEKCHFMVNEGIVLGHKISERGIEVDRAKVEAIEKMPYPRDVKDRKGADNPVADNLSRLENIAYDPVPVNDSFPNEQLAVIKNCKIEKLKLKEILMKREKNPSPSPPKE
ncbi:hypothetical protein QYE76_030659 [Lolium multiflorum]|uniref:Reverse transcriptase domain-containing protein n=1 Tax=Lolium multiflorum TaxID=4521 RepID=A0AAD8QRL2_LOLMU|nr:hypothetical protein QYE76_030659 [Lolium multiflorum]